ncbi:MAG: RNA methyltransferase [Betaproteobacteria bacterium]|nr:RNA methyltransferase [Betaproteobacteria bacterium]
MQVIRSRDNPMAKALSQLAHSARHRRKQVETVLDGIHLVGGYLQVVGRPIAVAVSETGLRHPEIARLLEHPLMPSVSVLTDSLFAECASVTAPVGIAAIVSIPQPPLEDLQGEPCLVLENIQDPGNLGTLLRSAAAAGIRHVLLSQGCTLAWAPRVLRAGQGAHFQLRVHENISLAEWARHYSGRLVGAVMHDARPYWELDLKGGTALVIGNEGGGISQPVQALLHERACIPMMPGVESLNAAIAGSVLLFERVRQQALKR